MRLSYKGQFVFSQPVSVRRSLWIHSFGTAPGGLLSGWALTR